MKHLIFALFVVFLSTSAPAQVHLEFVPLPESCRLLDTRTTGTALAPGVVLVIDTVACAIPPEARAIQANLTATNTRGPGFLALLKPVGRPSDAPPPKTSTLNYERSGQTIANAALITLGEPIQHWGGVFWLVAGVSGTDVIVDISGYYVAP